MRNLHTNSCSNCSYFKHLCSCGIVVSAQLHLFGGHVTPAPSDGTQPQVNLCKAGKKDHIINPRSHETIRKSVKEKIICNFIFKLLYLFLIAIIYLFIFLLCKIITKHSNLGLHIFLSCQILKL